MCNYCSTNGGYGEKPIHIEIVDEFCNLEVNIFDNEIEINPYDFCYETIHIKQIFTGFTFKINFCPMCGRELD